MPDPLKHVQEGDPISAAAWNEIIDRERAAREAEGNVIRRHGEVALGQQRTVVFVLNDSGYDCDRFAVLGIDDVFPTPTDNLSGFKDGPALHGITPAAGTHEGNFVVLLEPAEDGKIAQACVAGVCVVQVDVGDADHTHADIADGDRTQLETRGSTGSARIVWRESGTGTKWAIVRLGISRSLVRWGKLDSNLSAGNSANVSLWQTTGGGWEGWDEDSGENWSDVYAPPILPSGSLDSGKWVLVGDVNGRKVVLLTEC